MKRVLIVGAGGHGSSVAEAVLAGGEFVVAGFFNDAYPELERVCDFPLLGKVVDRAQRRGAADFAFVAVGNNVFRQRVTAGLRAPLRARLGDGVIMNCSAEVDHRCRVGDFGHLGFNAALAGSSVLGAAGWMQAGSALGYGVKIEAGLVLAPEEAVRS